MAELVAGDACSTHRDTDRLSGLIGPRCGLMGSKIVKEARPENETLRQGLLVILLSEREDLEKEGKEIKRVTFILAPRFSKIQI